jgi:hypothetical protein
MGKSTLRTLTIMAIAGMLSNSFYPLIHTEKRKRISEEELNRKRGLKEFIINGQSVWAINEKNAVRKADKIKNAR